MPFPKGTQGQTVSGMTSQTLAGTFSSNQELTLSNALFPEFHRSKKSTTYKPKSSIDHATTK